MSTKYKATVKGDKEMHGLQIRAIGFYADRSDFF